MKNLLKIPAKVDRQARRATRACDWWVRGSRLADSKFGFQIVLDSGERRQSFLYDVFQEFQVLLWWEHRRAGIGIISSLQPHCLCRPPGVDKTILLVKVLLNIIQNRFWMKQKVQSSTSQRQGKQLTIDIGKIDDLVLLMVDGSFGFEVVCTILPLPKFLFKIIQKTFEFLNIF